MLMQYLFCWSRCIWSRRYRGCQSTKIFRPARWLAVFYLFINDAIGFNSSRLKGIWWREQITISVRIYVAFFKMRHIICIIIFCFVDIGTRTNIMARIGTKKHGAALSTLQKCQKLNCGWSQIWLVLASPNVLQKCGAGKITEASYM